MTEAGPRAARRMRQWMAAVAGFIVLMVVMCPPEKFTAINVLPTVALNFLLLWGFAALARRVEQGRSPVGAFLAVLGYELMWLAMVFVAFFALNVSPNVWFVVAAQVVVMALAVRTLAALLPLVRGDTDAAE